ncbi:hypothetical protein M9Y10_041494 [Tritrichomonas musculus]|uniref:THO complex subunitTHOC2 C-terminal domain-containing protein n=1 Tax=Tritrichomonas musculus TaxID=1915356 RepID=A0ABR2K4H9_9EUKA
MDGNVYQILFQYINDSKADVEEVLNKLNALKCSKQEIASFIWSFLDISKGTDIFNENAYDRLQSLILHMSEKSGKYRKLFFIILDRADSNHLPEIDQMRKSLAIASRSRYTIEKYQLFDTNPEGFARLLLLFFKQCANPEDLLIVIGEHKIDPDVVLNILFDLIQRDKTYKFIPFFSIFSLEQVLPFAFNGIYNEGDDFYYCILSYFLYIKKIQYQNLWKLIGQPVDMLSDIYANYISAIETHADDLIVVRTILPGFTKEESYPPIYFEHEKEIIKYRNDLCHSFFFRLSAISQPFDFIIFGEISRFDPCLYKPIAEALSSYLYTKFLDDPFLFLKTQKYLDYLSTLNCHCTENKLIVGICRFPELVPPYIFSNFILPSISLNDCAWQLSIHAYECMMHYSMHIRRQIYKKFTENQNIIGDSIIKRANVTRKMTGILFKRLSIENVEQYSMEVSQLFLKSPSIASEKLLDYLFTITDIPTLPFLITADFSPLSLDYLFLEICDRIRNESLPNLSNWPIEIATFLGKIFSRHYNSMDLNGYISFIKFGLKRYKLPYLCLLKALITEMATVNYRGNLSKSDIELRTGENLLNFDNRIKIDNCEEFNFSTKGRYLQMLLLKDKTAIEILTCLDHMLQLNDASDPDQLDEIRFTFITICDFLSRVEITNLSPLQLINDLHFSLPSATRISRRPFKELQGLSPKEVPSELFGRFWSYSTKDFHVPTAKYNEIENQFNIRIEQSDDQEFKDSLIFVKEQLSISMEKQKKRVDQIRKEINSKHWFSPRHLINSIYTGFVNHCIFPRMMFSQEDARYCALFIFSIAHFTDFELSTFNEFFTKKLHFLILSATFEESRCIGLFLSKLLKYNRERFSESELHSKLIEKFQILLTHSNNSEFLTKKTIIVLDLISKDFPKSKEHEDSLSNLLEDLDSAQNQSISTQIKSYFTNRMVKVKKREMKKNSIFNHQNNKEEEETENEKEDVNYSSDENVTISNDKKRNSEEIARSHFKNTSSPTAKSMSLSSSASRLDIDSNRAGYSSSSPSREKIRKSNSTSKIKRSSSKREDNNNDDNSNNNLRRSNSVINNSIETNNNDIDTSSSAQIQANSSLDQFLYNVNSISSYYSVPQLSPYSMLSSQIMQLQLAAASAAAASATASVSSNDQQQQQILQNSINEQIGLLQKDQNQQQPQTNQTQYPYFLPYYYTYQ